MGLVVGDSVQEVVQYVEDCAEVPAWLPLHGVH